MSLFLPLLLPFATASVIFATGVALSFDVVVLQYLFLGFAILSAAGTFVLPHGRTLRAKLTPAKMSKRTVIALKVLLHTLCLAPLIWLFHLFTSGRLATYADPVNYITHFTGDWTLYILFASLAITPIRRLATSLGFLIRFRRLIGLYSFFYATLHLSTYIFLFSGYDVTTALTGLRSGHPGVLVKQWKLIWPGMVDDVLKRRFIQVGLFAWLILLALACTSPAFIMRAMGGKNWQRLHRLVYLGAFAGIVHYWWLVKTGNNAPWKDTVVLAILLLARVVYAIIKRFRKPASLTARDSSV